MDYHVLSQSEDAKTISVVFHFPVPVANNEAGVPYRDALVAHLGGANNITSEVANASELANMQAGEVYEVSRSIRWSRLGLTPAQKVAEIESEYADVQANMTAYFSTLLQYYGYEGDVS